MLNTKPEGTEIAIEGLNKPAIVHSRGLTIYGSDDQPVCIVQLCSIYDILLNQVSAFFSCKIKNFAIFK